jgi:hypothetical protein
MFVDVIVKHKGETERNIATIGRPSDYLEDVAKRFENNHDLEYIKLQLSTFWRNKLKETTS